MSPQPSVSAPSQINRVGGEKPMSTSLYDLSVPTFLQTVRSIGGFLDRAARHFVETGVDPDSFVNTRLFNDMAPFHFQTEAGWHHPVGGGEALKTGEFPPPAEWLHRGSGANVTRQLNRRAFANARPAPRPQAVGSSSAQNECANESRDDERAHHS